MSIDLVRESSFIFSAEMAVTRFRVTNEMDSTFQHPLGGAEEGRD